MIFLTQTLTHAVNCAPTPGTLTPTQTSVAVKLIIVFDFDTRVVLVGWLQLHQKFDYPSRHSLSSVSCFFPIWLPKILLVRKILSLCFHITSSWIQEYYVLVELKPWKHLHGDRPLRRHTSSSDWYITVHSNITSCTFFPGDVAASLSGH